VLFARADSVYKLIAGCDVWDLERDALRWPGGCACIAHPPCRAWGKLKYFARPRCGERWLAVWSVLQVRRWGGVMEHPYSSSIWQRMQCLPPGQRDQWGGICVSAPQQWWGHRCRKDTIFYICNLAGSLPEIPYVLGEAARTISGRSRGKGAPGVGHAEREQTPALLAKWLVAVAQQCSPRTG